MERPAIKPGSCKVYVDVSVVMTRDGKVIPTSLVWEDGKRYKIDRVLSVRPAPALRAGGQGDRYEIMIDGKISRLWFTHNEDISDPHIGWWFAEKAEVGGQKVTHQSPQ